MKYLKDFLRFTRKPAEKDILSAYSLLLQSYVQLEKSYSYLGSRNRELVDEKTRLERQLHEQDQVILCLQTRLRVHGSFEEVA